jgi:hypothetical protein
MADVIYNVTWDAVAGSTGYLIEYRESDSSIWVSPLSSTNPTLFTYYSLVLEEDKMYYVRISSLGGSCTTKYTIFSIDTYTTTTTTTTTSTTSTTTIAGYNFRITSTLVGSTVTNVTGFSYIINSGSYPISPGNQVRGNHSGWTGNISVTLAGSFTSGNFTIYRDATFLACIPVSGPGTYNSSLYTFTPSEVLNIYVNNGSCI